MKTAKGAPRLLPTLTEVVKPRKSGPPTSQAQRFMVDQISENLLAQVEVRLRAALEDSLQKQVSELSSTIRKEVEIALQQALAQQNGDESSSVLKSISGAVDG
ncbi:MAG: hypothetical protein K9K38_12845 [Rhodoferax sp.]|nr:hypothetical protein [Rhodoferax sp.]MCF8210266.1 hypothetical protein [Rhodoferax sp.]